MLPESVDTWTRRSARIDYIKEGIKKSAVAFGTATAEIYYQLPNQRAGWCIGHIGRECALAEVITSTTPPVDPAEQEQPDDINKVPVPSGSLETDVRFSCKVTFRSANCAYQEEARADEHMEAMEAGCEIEGRGIDAIGHFKRSMAILISLGPEEQEAQYYRYRKPADKHFPVTRAQSVMGNRDGGTGR